MRQNNMEKNDFVTGLFLKMPAENAPEFVLLKGSFHVDSFIEWLRAQERSEKGYVNFDVLRSEKGTVYAKVNNWKPGSVPNARSKDSVDPDTGETINLDDIPF